MITKLSAALNARPATSGNASSNEPEFTSQLTDAEFDQSVFASFAALEDQVQKASVYWKGKNESNIVDGVSKLGADVDRAKAVFIAGDGGAQPCEFEDLSASTDSTALGPRP